MIIPVVSRQRISTPETEFDQASGGSRADMTDAGEIARGPRRSRDEAPVLRSCPNDRAMLGKAVPMTPHHSERLK